MKKYILGFAALLAVSAAQAQELSSADGLLYAQDNVTGTARFRAMSGAFGALGGDLSAIGVNPAGSAIFNSSLVGFSLTSYNSRNKANYFGSSNSDNYNSFDVNQAGGAFVFDNYNPDSKWKKFAIAVNYDNVNNFDNDYHINGTNPTNSVDSYFLGYANGGSMSGFAADQTYLGYQAFVINETGNNAVPYASNVPAGGNYYQDFLMETRGYNGKASVNASAQYGERWFFGLNVNAHFSDYSKWASFYESNNNDPAAGLQWVEFNNEVRTFGSGVSLQAGTIVKVAAGLRAGVAYETPTWLWLNDDLLQSISYSDATNGSGRFSLPVTEYETYKLRTPGKWTGSLAYIFGTHGLISVDYSIKDYSNMHYGSTSSGDNFYADLNQEIKNTMDVASTLRLGAEVRAAKWSFRGGYRYEQSPYKDDAAMGDLTGFSGGLGYNFGRTRLDLAYSYWERDFQQRFFATGLTDPSEVTSRNHNVTASLTFEFK
ncbi:transporter [Flavobacterium sp.]|uniref:OmpP1/FadL family transporter n=1 Tax=Flavobacterium sp. TaxID=239 RepID=UPI0012290049|nr:transporter [Flavobacterium sp.]RZJ71228.1 MAG: transporter [Flavobacterium sp.]